MQYRMLGNTGIRVSTIAVGCWPFAGDANWGEQDDKTSVATVHAALDAGVNFFDNAEAYGNGRSEEVLGRALEGHRHEAIIATKVGSNHLAPTELENACKRSLERLRTDYIDLYQIHWPSRAIRLEESLIVLEKLHQQGVIRAIGVCNFGLGDLADLLALGHVETNQLPYSLVWRGIEYGIQEKCIENGMGIICYMPLMQGLLTGKYGSADEVPTGRARTRHFSRNRPGTRHGEDGYETETFAAVDSIRRICNEIGEPMADVALAWVLAQQGVTAALAGSRSPEQIRQNAEASSLQLSPDVLQRLGEVTDPLKQKLGTNADMYEGAAKSRFR